jgi:hypothetical protein
MFSTGNFGIRNSERARGLRSDGSLSLGTALAPEFPDRAQWLVPTSGITRVPAFVYSTAPSSDNHHRPR